MSKKTIAILIAALLIATAAGCGKSGNDNGDKKVAAVSIVPQATFLEAVAGGLVEVATVIPPGSSPETYSPTPQQMVDLSEADLYFSIGVEAEEAGILDKLSELNKSMVFVDLAGIVADAHPDILVDRDRDPHIWVSPRRAIVMVDAMAMALAEMLPEHKAAFEANAAAYKKELEALDEELTALFADGATKPFIVYHPALGYFAEDYGLTMRTIEEEGKEATAKELQAVIDYAREEGITRIFYQKEFDSQQAEIIADEVGGEAVQINPLSGDYISNLKALAQELRKDI